MSTWQEFVTELTRCDVLSSARRQALEEWGEDIPTTVLFGKLGKAIAEHFDELNPDARTQFSKLSRAASLPTTGLSKRLWQQAC